MAFLARKYIETTNATQVYSSKLTSTKIEAMIFVNTGSSQITIDSYYTRGSESAEEKHAFTNYQTPIAANDTYMFAFPGDGWDMNSANDKLWVKCDTANSLVVNVKGKP